MQQPRIAVVISTTRQGRFGNRPAQWITALARARGFDAEIVDLRDHPLPMFDEPISPAYRKPEGEAARRWAATVARYDGYVFVTAEYNRTIPAVLKNALEHVYPEFARKPVAFVGYGTTGAARAVEHLRNVMVEFHAAPLRHAVHVNMSEFLGMLQGGKDFADYPYLAQSAELLLTDLAWWTATLRAGREAEAARAA